MHPRNICRFQRQRTFAIFHTRHVVPEFHTRVRCKPVNYGSLTALFRTRRPLLSVYDIINAIYPNIKSIFSKIPIFFSGFQTSFPKGVNKNLHSNFCPLNGKAWTNAFNQGEWMVSHTVSLTTEKARFFTFCSLIDVFWPLLVLQKMFALFSQKTKKWRCDHVHTFKVKN